ncbi:hypothetical protein AAHZ94_20775 [Streptomyces sp. HSW2009]|uniref:hypothetical protein n=1 Tax=Streptomyces sp. HSW2009 TaxID=3142890 RepID=UPI0032EE8E5F
MTRWNELTAYVDGAAGGRRSWAVATVVARLALAAGFLSAVADRFGLWGEAGTNAVAWGDYDAYLAYVHDLAPYLSGGLVDVAGGAATAVELVLGGTLLLGVWVRLSAWASAAVLCGFALSMFFFADFEAPLNSSVFSAAAAALLLALAPADGLVLTLDRRLAPGRDTVPREPARRG